MALDLELMAIVDDGSLEAWASRVPEAAEDLQFLREYFTGARGSTARDRESDRELHRVARGMAVAHPGIAERRFRLGRAWDVLHFVLTVERRLCSSGREAREPGTLAVRGLRELEPRVTATQGHPLRVLPAREVPRVTRFLESLPREAIRVGLEEIARTGAVVYKASPERALEWHDELVALVEGLSAFHEAVRLRGEAVLFVLD